MDLIIAIVSYMKKEPEEKVRIHLYKTWEFQQKLFKENSPACLQL